MAKLIITRSSEWMNMARAIGVYIDGQKSGTISNGATKEFEVSPGNHLLKTKIDWCGSREFSFSVSENETKAVALSSFGYSWHFMLISFGIIALNLVSYFLFKIYSLAYLIIPDGLIMLYYISFGRNSYLVVKEQEIFS